MTPKKKTSKGKPKGKAAPQLTQKQRIEVAVKICDLYALGEETIESICNSFEVPYRTFHSWATPDGAGYVEEIEELYKTSKDKSDKVYMDRLKTKCRTALEKLVDGYVTEERHQEIDIVVQKDELGNPVIGDDGKPVMVQIPKKARIVKKEVGPNVPATIWGSKNADKEYFKDRYDVDVGGDAVTGLFEYYRNKGKQLRGEEKMKK